MGGMCGWLGHLEDPTSRLEAMTRPLAGDGDRCLHRSGSGGAVGVASGDGGTAHLESDDSYVCGWVGSLQWSTARSDANAQKEGHGAAVAAAYRERGPRLVEDLRGDYALAFLDLDEQELLLAVDRFGIRSLKYCPTPEGAAFATDGDALRAHPRVPSDVDVQSIYDFVYFHMVPSPRSVYRGWKKLLPGELVLVSKGHRKHDRYWSPSYESPASFSEADGIREFRETMRDAVRSSLSAATGRVGAFLSGGTDSSTVAGLVGELTGEPAETFSIGFDVAGYDESSYADIAVRHFGANHHRYTVTPHDVVRGATRIAAAYDEPFGNASAVASLYCAELAKRDGIGTLLAGDGGDEIFAGNERYAKQKLFQHYYRLPAAIRQIVIEPLVEVLPETGLGPFDKAGSYVRQARIPLPDRLETYNFLSRMPPSEIFAPGFLASIRAEEPLELLRETFAEAPTRSMLHGLLYLDLKFTLADNDLRKVGRTCEMAGISVGYPFLDLALVELANRIPPDVKLKGQKLRYFFKKASEGFLPPEILTKPKHGFGVPCGVWMRDHPALRELAYDSLSSLVRRDYLSSDFVERLQRLHRGDHGGYYGVMVWVLTMLELWHQHHAR